VLFRSVQVNGRTRRAVGTAAVAATLTAVAACTPTPTSPPGPTAPPASAAPTMVELTRSPLPTSALFDGIARDRHPGFPIGTISWDPAAAPLPEDRAVGPASLLLHRQQESHLLMPDGTQWTVDSAEPVGLSPNGRWLGYRNSGIVIFRDLAGTDMRALPAIHGPTGGITWSPSGRWLTAVMDGDYPRFDLTTGAVTYIPTFTGLGWSLLDSGNMASADCVYRDRQAVDVLIQDPLDPHERKKKLTFDAAPYLRWGERMVLAPTDPTEKRNPRCGFRVGPRDDAYLGVDLIPASGHDWTRTIGRSAYLVISLRTGRLLRRVDLSTPLGSRDALLGSVGDTLLVRHPTGDKKGANTNPSELWEVNMRTGTIRVRTRLTAGMSVIPPGEWTGIDSSHVSPGDPGPHSRAGTG